VCVFYSCHCNCFLTAWSSSLRVGGGGGVTEGPPEASVAHPKISISISCFPACEESAHAIHEACKLHALREAQPPAAVAAESCNRRECNVKLQAVTSQPLRTLRLGNYDRTVENLPAWWGGCILTVDERTNERTHSCTYAFNCEKQDAFSSIIHINMKIA
jgi:hypothetical protein